MPWLLLSNKTFYNAEMKCGPWKQKVTLVAIQCERQVSLYSMKNHLTASCRPIDAIQTLQKILNVFDSHFSALEFTCTQASLCKSENKYFALKMSNFTTDTKKLESNWFIMGTIVKNNITGSRKSCPL